MHLPIEYLAAESLNGEGSGVIDFATSDDYSFKGVTGKHYRTVKIGAKKEGKSSPRPTYRVYE